ncbi:MAG: FAD-dependent oxidoreductase [Chloroflexi bacterium]|jgi:thioredoxin reductase|nr:FAD-dependent oxidoreductase [Chloroflexota bacterium]MBT5320553.1 FAD-dependent oxidoreductase [Chloroflexota bacterium]MBT6682975.1 FAD-dependent oxidoreductase [Chloroflexota bacterium]
MTNIRQVDVAVIGGGPAGMAAAAAARDAGAGSVVLIERDSELGGVLNQCIHDGFGTKIFKEALTGPEYAAIYAERVREGGIELLMETTVLELTEERILTVLSENGMESIEAGAVVLAMGCRERPRGAIGIPGSRPAGVYTAGAVQNYMNLRNLAVGRKVMILGSGDIGLIMARRLTLEGAEVVGVAEILPYPSGLARNVVQCLEDFNIPLHLNTTVSEIHGTERVEGVTLAKISGMDAIPGTEWHVDCDTLMLSVGLIPENELSRQAGVEIDPVTAGPIVDDAFQTHSPGVFACGNVLQVHDIVDYATMEAEIAGTSAAAYIAEGTLPDADIKITAGDGLRYVLPSQVSGLDAVNFTMRVTKPDQDRAIVFSSGGKVIRKLKQQALSPASMARVRLGKARFSNTREIHVEVAD